MLHLTAIHEPNAYHSNFKCLHIYSDPCSLSLSFVKTCNGFITSYFHSGRKKKVNIFLTPGNSLLLPLFTLQEHMLYCVQFLHFPSHSNKF